ncbi:MAG: hypothetical protein WCC73_11985 [Terracidiphilus sp.]
MASFFTAHTTPASSRSSTTNEPFTTSTRNAAVSHVVLVCIMAGRRALFWFPGAAKFAAHCEKTAGTGMGATTWTPPCIVLM